MKNALLLACTALALTACSKKEETTVETPAATDTAMATPMASATTTGPATGNMAGKYEVTMADGRRMTSNVNADGTYVDVMDGKEMKGTWRMDGAKSCFDEEGDVAEVCYTTSAPAADGSFQTMDANGKVTSTVSKIG